MTSAISASPTVAERHVKWSMTQDITGRNANWPKTLAAVSRPVTRPHRATNQRCVTVAANAIASAPQPTPTNSPHPTTRCQESETTVVSPAPAAISSSAATATRRMPKRSISAAENGAVSP
ncbi:hypothetical protein SAMN05216215_101736 [Saccharopolyspora shandongensis]|uniref:Uncharacterized protein n=1 Tax=Saccharopolyspora shandongensis TaxID=418495 RepID=A0A1H3FIU4_9PSEU|nr:hypothetical protein SAMN05216215_101736 [Saccharopolyspora shandongensis]